MRYFLCNDILGKPSISACFKACESVWDKDSIWVIQMLQLARTISIPLTLWAIQCVPVNSDGFWAHLVF